MRGVVELAASNAALATLLAVIAYLTARWCRRPRLMYSLWLLVLIKLVTPPLLEAPIPIEFFDEIGEARSAPQVGAAKVKDVRVSSGETRDSRESALVSSPSLDNSQHETAFLEGWPAQRQDVTGSTSFEPKSWDWLGVMFWIWVLGLGIVLLHQARSIFRFHRHLVLACQEAPANVQARASSLAQAIGLRRTPTVYTVQSRITPLVWWVGGAIRIVMPKELFQRLSERQWTLVLAHELMHVRRRDYLTRWLELVTCCLYWWLPIFWWAQRRLRDAEEQCCDAQVTEMLEASVGDYAESLLRVVEYLADRARRPPVVASGAESGGNLKRRLSMLLSRTTTTPIRTWLGRVILALAVLALPFSLTLSAQEKGPEPKIEVRGKVIVVGPDGKKQEIDLGDSKVPAKRKKDEDPKDKPAKAGVGFSGKIIIVGPDGKKQEIDLGKGGKAPGLFGGKMIIIGPDGKKREIELGKGGAIVPLGGKGDFPEGIPEEMRKRILERMKKGIVGKGVFGGKMVIIGPDGKKKEIDLGKGGFPDGFPEEMKKRILEMMKKRGVSGEKEKEVDRAKKIKELEAQLERIQKQLKELKGK